MPKVLIGNIAGPPGEPGVAGPPGDVGAPGTAPRTSVAFTTASLASNARHSGLVLMGASYHLIMFEASAPCRIRLYDTQAHRDADALRPVGTDPSRTTDTGVMFDYLLTAAGTRTLTPQVIGSTLGGDSVPILVDNINPAPVAITVTLTYLKME